MTMGQIEVKRKIEHLVRALVLKCAIAGERSRTGRIGSPQHRPVLQKFLGARKPDPS